MTSRHEDLAGKVVVVTRAHTTRMNLTAARRREHYVC